MTHLVMKMGPGSSAGCAHVANNLAPFNKFPGSYCKTGKVSIVGFITIAMIDNHQVTVASLVTGKYNFSFSGRHNFGSVSGKDIYAGMELETAAGIRNPPHAVSGDNPAAARWPN